MGIKPSVDFQSTLDMPFMLTVGAEQLELPSTKTRPLPTTNFLPTSSHPSPPPPQPSAYHRLPAAARSIQKNTHHHQHFHAGKAVAQATAGTSRRRRSRSRRGSVGTTTAAAGSRGVDVGDLDASDAGRVAALVRGQRGGV